MALKVAKLEAPVDEKLEQSKHQDRTRDETQRQIDAEVGAIVKAWRDMPGNTPLDRRPRLRFAVDPDDRAEMKSVIRRATTLHKVSPEFFKDSVDAKGRTVITFTVGPPKAKTH